MQLKAKAHFQCCTFKREKAAERGKVGPSGKLNPSFILENYQKRKCANPFQPAHHSQSSKDQLASRFDLKPRQSCPGRKSLLEALLSEDASYDEIIAKDRSLSTV